MTIWCYFDTATTPYIVASFTFSPINPAANESVTFNGTNSGSSSPITNWKWEFGDSNTTQGSYPTITHKYAANGTYTIKLTITSLDGTNNQSVGITVGWGAGGPAPLSAGILFIGAAFFFGFVGLILWFMLDKKRYL